MQFVVFDYDLDALGERACGMAAIPQQVFQRTHARSAGSVLMRSACFYVRSTVPLSPCGMLTSLPIYRDMALDANIFLPASLPFCPA